MQLHLDPRSVESYRTFLKIKQLPSWSLRGRVAEFPDEYAGRLGFAPAIPSSEYTPEPWLYDYQGAIASTAVARQKFAVFADCVAGETILEGPDGPTRIDDACRRGEPIRVWALDSHGNRVAAWATAPWVNGYAKLYRYTLASGKTITATGGHRFMAPDAPACDFGPFAPRRNYVAEVNAKFYPWTVAFLTLVVAYLCWRVR